MEDLCTACHCAGRKLFYIHETGFEALYTQIINEIPVYNLSDLCVRVCWECKALLRRLGRFKEQVKTCYTQLLQYVQQNSAKPFPTYPRLQIEHINTTSFPQIIVKEELEDKAFDEGTILMDDGIPITDDVPYHDDDDFEVKTEETHCEPETFVKDLNLDVIKKKRNVKKVVKPLKEKSRRKENKKNEKEVKKKTKSLDTKHTESTIEDVIDSTVEDCFNKEGNRKEDVNAEVEGVSKPIREKSRRKEKIKNEKEVKKKTKSLDTKHTESTIEDVIDSTVEDCFNKEGNRREDVNAEVEGVSKLKTSTNGQVKTSKLKESDTKETLPDRPTCTECGKTFSSRKTYRYHLNVLHKGQNRYPCPICGKIYQWKSNLGRHMRSHKARDSGELFCETCDKSFASVATYRQHLRISRRHVPESEFSFMCNVCGKKFVNKTRLRDHIDWEHLKKIKFKCQLCNKPFKCHTSLYVHMQNVHRSKDKKDNLCHVCGKSYQNAAKLKYHIVAMHTTETPYQCTQCAAAFGWYSSLYRHVREVHYKMKVQPKKNKKQKKSEVLPPLLPMMPQQLILPPIHQAGPT